MNTLLSLRTFTAAAIFGLALVISISADNALENGDFEQGSAGWITWGAQVSGELQYKGSYGAGIYASEAEWKGMHQKIKVPQNARTFKVSGYMKTDEVNGGKKFWERALISMEFVDEVDSIVGQYPAKVALIEGTTDWTKYSKKYSVNFLAPFLKVTLALGNATGSVQYDNISLVFYDAEGKELDTKDFTHKELPILRQHDKADNQLQNGDFSRGIQSWSATEEMLDSKSGLDSSPCLLLGKNQKAKWASQQIDLPIKVHRIVVTAYIATDNLKAGKEFWECANVAGELLDEKGIRIGNWLHSLGNVEGTSDFQEYSIVHAMRPGAKSFRLTVGHNGTEGFASFDNIKVTFFDANGNEIKAKGK